MIALKRLNSPRFRNIFHRNGGIFNELCSRGIASSSNISHSKEEWNASEAGWNPSHSVEIMLKTLSEEQVRRVGVRSQEEFLNHILLKTSFPEKSLPPEGTLDRDLVRRKRLIYRSKQRGWLEVDVLLGTFAERNVMSLSKAEMDEYEAILNCETLDIFQYISGSGTVPPHLDTAMMKRLQEYAMSSPLGSTPESYAAAKRANKLT